MHCTHHEENHIDAQDLHPQSEIPTAKKENKSTLTT